MKVGKTDITPGTGNPYIVAEVGSNWHTFDDCVESIKEASRAGANAVKFQLFNHHALYGVSHSKKSGYDDKYELPIDWLPRLKNAADQAHIDFMCTVFDHAAARVVDPFVYAHKIASSDINYEQLLSEVNRLGKPVFLSTGAATEVEIRMACANLSTVPAVVMYCVAAYPARNIDLTIIEKLRQFSQYTGFSDHTTDYLHVPYSAAKHYGISVLEKHFTAIKELTPDTPHSLNPVDFKFMVDRIRGKRTGNIGPTDEERDMILRHKRRLVTTEGIKRGELFKRDKNYGVYRSVGIDTKGLSPLYLGELHNKTATRDIEPGDSIGASDYQ